MALSRIWWVNFTMYFSGSGPETYLPIELHGLSFWSPQYVSAPTAAGCVAYTGDIYNIHGILYRYILDRLFSSYCTCMYIIILYSDNLILLWMMMIIIQYNSTVYSDHKGLGFLAPKYHPQTSLIFTLWHLGRIG